MKQIPAFARIWFFSPASLRRPATMAIPHMQHTDAKSMSFRRPTLSTMAVPTRAPIKEVAELTKLRTRWRSGETIPACSSKTGRKSMESSVGVTYIIEFQFRCQTRSTFSVYVWLNWSSLMTVVDVQQHSQVIKPLPDNWPQHETIAHSPKR
jgi:hypothetical protein